MYSAIGVMHMSTLRNAWQRFLHWDLAYAVRDWFVQIYLERVVQYHAVTSQVLFDFKNGEWEELISGPEDDRTSGLVHVFIDQMLATGDPAKLVIVVHTRQDSGYVMGMTHEKKHKTFFFRAGTYEMAQAFTDICLWIKEA
jgi:hypothetical protein